MKPLLLMIITIIFSSTVYAELEELDREKYVFYCVGDTLEVDKYGNTGCKGIRKGDVLMSIDVINAVLYCDPSSLMFESSRWRNKERLHLEEITCIYNGKPIKERDVLK